MMESNAHVVRGFTHTPDTLEDGKKERKRSDEGNMWKKKEKRKRSGRREKKRKGE